MNYKNLENLPTEVLFTIALNLGVPGILKMCKLSKTLNERVCENDLFWRTKFRKDMINQEDLTSTQNVMINSVPVVISDNMIKFILEANDKDPKIIPNNPSYNYIIKMIKRGLTTKTILQYIFNSYIDRNKFYDKEKPKRLNDPLIKKYFGNSFDKTKLYDSPDSDLNWYLRFTHIDTSAFNPFILGYYPNNNLLNRSFKRKNMHKQL